MFTKVIKRFSVKPLTHQGVFLLFVWAILKLLFVAQYLLLDKFEIVNWGLLGSTAIAVLLMGALSGILSFVFSCISIFGKQKIFSLILLVLSLLVLTDTVFMLPQVFYS